MRAEELRETYEVESRHWWFRGKRILFERLLADRLQATGGRRLRILDVGCGAGAVSAHFSRYGDIVAADRSTAALGFTRSRGIDQVFGASAPGLPFAPESFDLILAFDVIEHVDDDRTMVAELAASLRPGGALAVHVPAWPSLWSRHDVLLEHKRRYTRRSLRTLLDGSGLELEHFGWASAAILPAVAAVRGLGRLRRNGDGDDAGGQDLGDVPAPLNAALVGLYRVEAALAATTGLPFGLSLAAVAAKPA